MKPKRANWQAYEDEMYSKVSKGKEKVIVKKVSKDKGKEVLKILSERDKVFSELDVEMSSSLKDALLLHAEKYMPLRARHNFLISWAVEDVITKRLAYESKHGV